MAAEIITNLKEIQKKHNLSSEIPIFATQEYANYLLETKNIKTIWFIEKVDDSISLIIPFALKKKLIFKIGYFLTAVNNLANISAEEEKEFLEEVVSLIREKKLCDWIQQPPNWAIFNNYPRGSIFAPFGTFRINLQEKSLDELFNSIQKDDQRDIKKAIRENVLIKIGLDYLSDALRLINATASEAGMAGVSIEEINTIKTYLGNDLWNYVAFNKVNIPQSSVIFFSNNFSTYGMFAGSIKKPVRGSTSYLHWEAIKNSKLNNVKYYDFVGARLNPKPGSKQARIQRFKAHFGVELIEGFLWKMPISKAKYYFYNLFVRMHSIIRLKQYKGDIIDQERSRI